MLFSQAALEAAEQLSSASNSMVMEAVELGASVDGLAAEIIRHALELEEDDDVPASLLTFLNSITEGTEFVSSSHNLYNYLTWAKTASREELLISLALVSIIEHEMGDNGFASVPSIIDRPDIGLRMEMPVEACTADNCIRCTTGRGGYAFRFIGPWTCHSAIGNENTTRAQLYEAEFWCRCPMCYRH